MGYYISLNSLGIDRYKTILEAADLLPGRMVLKENIEERFARLKCHGIRNVHELQQTLKNKKKFSELSEVQCLGKDYLTVLLREINSLHPKPNKIKDFTGISPDTVVKLESVGICTTLDMFGWITKACERKMLAEKTQVNENEILGLTKLTDLSRIRWVGTTFARVLYETGYDTAEKVSKADIQVLYEQINQINSDQLLFRGKIGLHDVKLCVEAAKDVSPEIEY